MSVTFKQLQEREGKTVTTLSKEELFYPLMENEKYDFGYQGTVLYDKADDKIQCNVCGKWYKSLSSHLRKHQINVEDYKIDSGIKITTPLCTPEVSKKHRQTALKTGLSQYRTQSINKKPNKRKIKYSKNCSESKNKQGVCDAQINDFLNSMAEKLDKDRNEITSVDIKNYNPKLYSYLKYHNGLLINGRKFKFIPVGSGSPVEKFRRILGCRNRCRVASEPGWRK